MLNYGFTGSGLLGNDLDKISPLTSMILNLLMLFIMLLAYLYIYKTVYAKGLIMPPRNADVVLIGIYCIYVLIMSLIFTAMEDEGIQLVAEYGVLRAIFAMITAGVALGMPYFIVRNRLSAYYKDLSDHQQSFLDAELAASRQYREAQEETRAFRHDVQNELAVISALMKEKRYDEAEEYLNDMLTEVRALSPRVVTGDDMLDTLHPRLLIHIPSQTGTPRHVELLLGTEVVGAVGAGGEVGHVAVHQHIVQGTIERGHRILDAALARQAVHDALIALQVGFGERAVFLGRHQQRQ
jgi:pentatricopeptide repeat protein